MPGGVVASSPARLTLRAEERKPEMNLTRTFPAVVGTVSLAAATLLLVSPCPLRADDERATIGEIAVEGVAATSAKAGEATRITFSIENAGAERVTITGVRWPTGEPARVMGFLGSSHSAAISGLTVDAGETLQLDGRSAWVEVGPLKADLAPGSVVQAYLVLARYEAPIPVHVSPATQREAAVEGSSGREDASVGLARWWNAKC